MTNHFHLKPLHSSNKIIPKKLNCKAALTQETWILGAFKVKRPVSALLSVSCLLWASSHSPKAERERESHYVRAKILTHLREWGESRSVTRPFLPICDGCYDNTSCLAWWVRTSAFDVELISTWALTASYFLKAVVTKITIYHYFGAVTFHSLSALINRKKKKKTSWEHFVLLNKFCSGGGLF